MCLPTSLELSIFSLFTDTSSVKPKNMLKGAETDSQVFFDAAAIKNDNA